MLYQNKGLLLLVSFDTINSNFIKSNIQISTEITCILSLIKFF